MDASVTRNTLSAPGSLRHCLFVIVLLASAGGCSSGGSREIRSSDTANEYAIVDGAGLTEARSVFVDDAYYGMVTRKFLLHLPSGMDGSQSWPLVFVFHGTGGDSYSQEARSKFSLASDANGFIVVYPQALGTPRDTGNDIHTTLPGTPNAPSGWNTRPAARSYGAVNNVDDVGFIHQLYATLIDQFPIDESRVYSTGLSNGCGFTTILMARMNDMIAATAQNACGMYPVDVVPPGLRKIPFIVLHGTDDQVVPYDGGEGTAVSGGRPPLPEVMADWAVFYQCDGERVIRDGDIERLDYQGCVEDISFITVHGGGHRWYPWQAEIIWEFFAEHPLD